MVDYREILRLKSLNYSNFNIASCVHSSRNTVREVLSIAQALQVQWPLADDVTNQMLHVNVKHFFTRSNPCFIQEGAEKMKTG